MVSDVKPPGMGSNVLENKPSELFPCAAAIDVNLGSAISHDIMAEAAYFC